MDLSQNRGPALGVMVSVVLAITTIAVALRFYVRISIQKMFWVDDYILLLTYVCFVIFVSFIYIAIQLGLGKHNLELLATQPKNLPGLLKSWWISELFYDTANCSIKVAVVVFFCSLQPPARLRIAAIITACVSVINGMTTVLIQAFQCWPISYFWTRARLESFNRGTCLDLHILFVIMQVQNTIWILCDIVLAVLPWIMVSRMYMKRSDKIVVPLLLSTGVVPAGIAFARSFYLASIFIHSGDQMYTSIPIIWTGVGELSISILVICIARFRPLVRKYAPVSWLSAYRNRPQDEGQEQVITIGRKWTPRRHALLPGSEFAVDEEIGGSSITSIEPSSHTLKSSYELKSQCELKDSHF